METLEKLISINPALNRKAKFFGFMPISQVMPLGVIAFFCFLIVGAAGGKDKHFGIAFGFMTGTWLLATGAHPHHMTDRMRPFPGKNWAYTRLPYVSPIPENRPAQLREAIKDDELTLRPKYIAQAMQNGKKEIYAPFVGFQHLTSLIKYSSQGKDRGALFLKKGQQYQIVFCFKLTPWHSIFTPKQAYTYIEATEAAAKEIMPAESLTFYCEKYADDTQKTAQLKQVISNCDSEGVTILAESELGKTQSLSAKGLRQNLSYTITCTYTFSRGGDVGTDFVSTLIRMGNKLLSTAAGDKNQLQQNFYHESLESAYNQGFLIWQSILKTAWKLDIKPLTVDQTWNHLWYQFNARSTTPKIIPNYWTWDGRNLGEVINTPVHPLSILAQGIDHIHSTPQHNQRHDEIVLPGRRQICGVMTIEEISRRKLNTIEQLNHLFEIMQSDDVIDTEFVIQLNTVSSQALDQQLEQTIAQANSAKLMAEESAIGRDVKSEQMLEESFEAQKLVGGGGAGIYLSFLAKVYRSERQTLDEACSKLSRRFSGNLKRQDSAIWALWLETLPMNIGRILHKTSIVEDRRIKLDNLSYYRYLPNLAPEDVHQDGIELIVKGGKPIYLDMFRENTLRGLIIGESGSGKSVIAWRIILDFLANNIPVIGMDSAVGGNSSFRWAIKMLEGAHIDISLNSSNLVEPPDLRDYQGDDYQVRFKQWKETVKNTLTNYIMFGIDDPKLTQRVESTIVATIEKFINHNKIKRRINQAFEAGYGSPQWDKIPVLADWLTFCTKEKLNLRNFEELDKQAINQIRTQVTTLLSSALGDTVGRPSTFDPRNRLKFFTIVNLESERDQVLVAQTIQSTCIRLALQYPKSLIVGDEIADLLKKGGFAKTWGAMHAMARKSGISLLTISQNIEEIQKCSAAADILKNISFKLIGRITTDGATSLVESLKYPDLVYENSTKAFNTDKEKGCSHWLLEMQNQFWQTQFFPSLLNLAMIANGADEIKIRTEIMDRAIANRTSRWVALKEYGKAITGG
jgi:ABC-type dipeptide/oligopeptide/nickel transport system ATPase component